MHVHGVNPRKEDYWQDLPKTIFECEICKTKFVRKPDLRAHIKKQHMGLDKLKCDQCHSLFNDKKSLKRHKLEKHETNEKKFKCPECGKMFGQKRNMERHVQSHIKE